MITYLIIPMGGKGKRFLNAGYNTYKPFLSISKNTTIVDNILDNFDTKKIKIIIIGNKKKIRKYKIKSKKKLEIIDIKNHSKGPLYSILLAKEKIKEVVKNNNIFICYSDINWKWNFKEISNFIKNKQSIVFTHSGYHPHLEVDQKSDFCLINKNNTIKSISQKKTHFSDYKNEHLAIGCYYFINFNLISESLKKINFISKQKKKEEFYLVSLIKILLNKKIKVFSKKINKFVHLGNPAQYEDFLNWKKIVNNSFEKSLNLKEDNNVMLMGGKGERMKGLSEKKPFLKINNTKIFEYIFNKFGGKKNIIITNSKYFKHLNKTKYLVHKIKKTNSMFSTFENSKPYLSSYKNFFLLSCDCFGTIKKNYFFQFLKKNKPELVIFGYKFSNLQKNLFNSHTELIIKNKNLVKINVKNNSNISEIGHAGFFWIKDNEIYKHINNFKIFFKKNIKNREILVDDYFSYILRNKLMNVNYYMLDHYIHIGSVTEYNEFNYWNNYFNNN